MYFIDSNSHLDFSEFDLDRAPAIQRAKNIGIKKIIISATIQKRWRHIQRLAEKDPIIAPAYGLHPMFLNDHKDQDLDRLIKRIEANNKVCNIVAVGEIGLDFFIPNPDKQAQLDLFTQQLDIATEYNLPVIIHSRKSLDLILKEIRKRPNLKGSIHCFSGSEQQAKQLINLGFHLGFGGPITYTRATKLRKLVSRLPLESILLETDSPDQPDSNHYGKRNEPAFLPNIAYEIADLRGIDVEQVAAHTFNNAKKLFNL